MIIGVDAGALGISDVRLRAGVYRINLHLLEELSFLDKSNSYKLYTFDPIDPKILKRFGSNFQNIVLHPKRGWFSLRLPLAIYQDGVDVFLGLSQAVPLLVKRCFSIGFIYDLAFLHYPQAYPDSLQRLQRQTDQVMRRSNHIVTISQASGGDLKKHYPRYSGAVTIAYPGVESSFSPQGKTYVWKNPYFLFVGSLKREKNIGTILDAFSRFVSWYKKPMDILLVGGDYWRDPKIDQILKKNVLKGRVHLLGYTDDAILPLVYCGAQALVTPSLWEGFCLPALEAMACGCPVIGSQTGAFPEVVGDAGILVNPLKEEEVCKAFLTILEGNARSIMSKKGIQKAKYFSWQIFAQKIYSIFNQT